MDVSFETWSQDVSQQVRHLSSPGASACAVRTQCGCQSGPFACCEIGAATAVKSVEAKVCTLVCVIICSHAVIRGVFEVFT